MDEEFEKTQKLYCLRNKRQKWHENEIVCGQLASRLIKILSSLDNCMFIGYIFVCWQTNQRKSCFKHFVHGQFNFQQLELVVFIDEGLPLHSTSRESITNREFVTMTMSIVELMLLRLG